jgi:hypothetical protein
MTVIDVAISVDEHGLIQHIEEAVIECVADDLKFEIRKLGWHQKVVESFKEWKDDLIRAEVSRSVERVIKEYEWDKRIAEAADRYIETAVAETVKDRLDKYIEAKAKEVWSG